ncbi:MAG: selenocysteine-specific translation elongation factor [Desulfovibrionales bacterium]
MPVIMGTAGHIDHGKTTLIKALTGIDCDRLKEEKKRGITIELGFAFLDLGEQRLGIVDVPGHERFVKNMVSGAAGIDFVLLVIAADEGVMPQTKEHLEICTLLGIEQGMVALTKVDMVDEDWLELVVEDVKEALSGTFLQDAEIFPVSSHTGKGLDVLTKRLEETACELKPKRSTDLVRVPIDRIFTMRGHGTVITGTMISGRLRLGQEVMVYPQGLSTKVRHLQVHGDAAQEAEPGRRTAINLHGLEVEQLERGQVVALPGTLFTSMAWDLKLNCLASTPRAIKHRTEIHFHHGSREILARLYFLDREKLEPGETALCQVRFAEPMVGVYGDRCVIRAYSPLRTIAGGTIINPLAGRIRRFSEDVKRLEALAEAEQSDELVRLQLGLAGPKGLSFSQLRIMTNVDSKELETVLQQLGSRQSAFQFDREEKIYVSGEVAETLVEQALETVGAFHRKHPSRQGVSRSELASSWGRKLAPKLTHFLLERMLKQGMLVSEGEVLRLPEHKVSLASDQETLKKAILDAYTKGGLTPPNLKDVLEPLKVTFKEATPVFRMLQEQGELVKIKEDMYFSRQAIDRLKELVVRFYDDHDDLSPVAFKELTGLSRKYAIPLLEWMDKEKITMRVGDVRKLRRAG